jgi:hypothetical protein
MRVDPLGGITVVSDDLTPDLPQSLVGKLLTPGAAIRLDAQLVVDDVHYPLPGAVIPGRRTGTPVPR